MKHTPNTLNEEINRMKSLFTEERLYGNLVEQEEKLKVQDSKGRTKEYSKEEVIEKIKKGKFTNDNVEIFVDKTLTPLVDIAWAKDALDGKNTDDIADDFGSRKIKKDKKKKDKEDKQSFGEKLKAKKEAKKKIKTCENGVTKYLNAYNESSEEGTEGQKKNIDDLKNKEGGAHVKHIARCAKKYKEEDFMKKLASNNNLGDFLHALEITDVFGKSDTQAKKDSDAAQGGGGEKTDKITIRSADRKENQIIGKFEGSGVWTLKSNTRNPILNANKKPLSWVMNTNPEDWPEGITSANFHEKLTDDGYKKGGKVVTIDIDKV